MSEFHDEAQAMLDAMPAGVRKVAADRASFSPDELARYTKGLAALRRHRQHIDTLNSLAVKLSTRRDRRKEPVVSLRANLHHLIELNDHATVMALIEVK